LPQDFKHARTSSTQMTPMRRHSTMTAVNTDDDVALHPMARRHVVAAVLLCVGMATLLWPAARAVTTTAEASCDSLDQPPSQAVARLIQDRTEAAEARINDAAVAFGRARTNCR
jgi:hypothetical protein